MPENLEIIKFSEVQEEALSFLVEPQFPLGKLVMCAGDGGVGKSSLMTTIAAKLTIGEPLPWSATNQNASRAI